MIALAILQQMNSENVAGLTLDKDFFWEELPLQKNGSPASGVWLVTRGGSSVNTPKGLNQHSTLDFYVAFANKAKTEDTHAKIVKWIRQNPTFCELGGSVAGGSYKFSNVRIRPTTTPQNYGATENGNIVKFASVEVIYDIAS